MIAGGVAIVAGLLSVLTVPEADTRAWDSLPRYLTFAALELPPGEHSLVADFRDAGGRTVSIRPITLTVPTKQFRGRDTVLFVSEHSH